MDFCFSGTLGQEPGSWLSWMLQAIGIPVLLIPLFLLISIGVVLWMVSSGKRGSLDETGGSIHLGDTRAVLATICGLVALGLVLFFSAGSNLLMVMGMKFPLEDQAHADLTGMVLGFAISQLAAVLLGLHALLFVSGASRLARTGGANTVVKIIVGVGGLAIATGGLWITVGSNQFINQLAVIADSTTSLTADEMADAMDSNTGLFGGLSCAVCGVLLVLVALLQVNRQKIPVEPKRGPRAGQGLMALGWWMVLFGGLSACLLIVIAPTGASQTVGVLLAAGENSPHPGEIAAGISTFYFCWLLAGIFLAIWGLGQILSLALIGETTGTGSDLAAVEPAGDLEPA